MKHKNIYLKLFLITLFAFLIRFMCIDKPEGLWNDEYISWYISTQPLFSEFINAVFKNCHMPFYYCYLKIWQFIFGSSDFYLRISSLVPGVLSVISMFFVGKKLKDDNCGLLCALFTAVSGFLVYFSQEVRFYSILFLFSSLSLLFTLNLIENQSRKNYILFCLSNILIMLTHTIGFVFVFFDFLFLFILLKKQNKISYKTIFLIIGATSISILPFAPFLYKTLTASYISQFWSDFSITKLFFVFADYVSPIQINIINTPINITAFLFKGGKFNYNYFIFAIIPLLIAIIGIINAIIIKSSEKIRLISAWAFCTLIIMIIASITGKMVLITKYTVEIYPIFIAITAIGLYNLRPETIRTLFILCFFGLSFFYLSMSDSAPQKLNRSEGHKLAADLIVKADLKKNDKILLIYYHTDRFGKYVNTSDYYIDSVTKYNFQYKLIHNPPQHFEVIQKGKEMFFDSFKSSDNEFFDRFLKEQFFNNMQKGDKFALVSLNSVAFINKERMQSVVNNESLYKRIPFLFLIFSHISNMTKQQADKYLKPVFNEKAGMWEIFVWEKV